MMKVNALGQPSPNRTDFKAWDRDALEKFARHCADDNLILSDKLQKIEFVFDRAFLDWCADRMVYVYGADPAADFVVKLRKMAGSR